MKAFEVVAAVLLVVGGLDWALLGAGVDVVAGVFGPGAQEPLLYGLAVLYAAVGLTAVWQAAVRRTAERSPVVARTR